MNFVLIQQNTKGNLRWQQSTNQGKPIRGFTVVVGAYSRGRGLLTIFGSRVGAYSRGGLSRGGGGNSRIYGMCRRYRKLDSEHKQYPYFDVPFFF